VQAATRALTPLGAVYLIICWVLEAKQASHLAVGERC
jgi:hypothetical protein